MDDMLSNRPGEQKLLTWPQAGESWPLTLVWQGLVEGRLRVVESWVATDQLFVSLRRLRGDAIVCKRPDVVRRVFSGDPPKVVAADLAISCSTICGYLKRFLELCSERPRAVGLPAFLAKAACAAGGSTLAPARFQGMDHEGNVVLSIDMPIAMLEKALSRAECDIAASILEGRSQAEIRAQRGTSSRTLANQIGSIYRKLRVSGRRELMAVVLSDSSLCGPANAF
jgi:DNA-binding CsgD family transcriptional regulator